MANGNIYMTGANSF